VCAQGVCVCARADSYPEVTVVIAILGVRIFATLMLIRINPGWGMD